MHRDKLGIYLNDHLAGATFGIGLAQRIAHQHRHSARSADLQRISDEVAQDRQTLLELMDALGVPARRYKVYGGWAAERLGRLKPNGVLYRRSGLSTFIELETLRLGVEGKTLIWRTLLVVAAGEPRLDESQLQALLDRARGQIDTLEKLRLAAAAAVFSSGVRSVTSDSP
ncbi:hypothetical protein ACFWNT_36960 [Streptomyces sp. NPDC058409]|uniref:hypothetical protein n=1 Tax=Streptomyces sp. NPDC058409 TaxID=3346484 RepID=UPI003659A1BC